MGDYQEDSFKMHTAPITYQLFIVYHFMFINQRKNKPK